MNAFDLIVSGDVQGVGFRRVVLKLARKFNVSGYVENLDDGTVQIRAQGTSASLDGFLNALNIKEFPILVEKIEKNPASASAEYVNFKIRYGNLERELEEGLGAGEARLSIVAKGIDGVKENTASMNKELVQMRGDIGGLRGDVGGLRTEVAGLRTDVGGLKDEVSGMRGDIGGLRGDVRDLGKDFSEYRTEFKEFSSGTNQNFSTLADRYDSISQTLSRVLEESAQTRQEFTNAINDLKRLAEEYFRIRLAEIKQERERKQIRRGKKTTRK